MKALLAGIALTLASTGTAVASTCRHDARRTGRAAGPRLGDHPGPGRTAARGERRSPSGRARAAETTMRSTRARRTRRMDGFGASITDSSANVLYRLAPSGAGARRCDRCSTRTRGRVSSCARRSARRTSPPRPQHYTYDDVPAGRGLRAAAVQHRARPGAGAAAATPGEAAQPDAEGDGDAVESARLDEDRRLPGRWSPQGRAGRLQRLRALPGEVRAGVRAAGVPVDFLSVQNEPQNRKPSAYPGTDMPVRQQAAVIEALGPMLRAASPRTKSPRLRPQLDDPPRRHRDHPARRGPGDGLPVPVARTARPASGSPVRRTTATRAIQRAEGLAPGLPGEGDLVHRVLRVARGRTTPPADLPRHPHLARAQLDRADDPELGGA